MKQLTVGDLKEIMKDLPDSTPVFVSMEDEGGDATDVYTTFQEGRWPLTLNIHSGPD